MTSRQQPRTGQYRTYRYRHCAHVCSGAERQNMRAKMLTPCTMLLCMGSYVCRSLSSVHMTQTALFSPSRFGQRNEVILRMVIPGSGHVCHGITTVLEPSKIRQGPSIRKPSPAQQRMASVSKRPVSLINQVQWNFTDRARLERTETLAVGQTGLSLSLCHPYFAVINYLSNYLIN